MSKSPQERTDATRDAAADWLLRIRRPEADEGDWLAFEAWLAASPDHAAAYDAVLAVWEEVGAAAPALKANLAEDGTGGVGPRIRASRRWAIAAGLAAALAVAVVPWRDVTAPTTVYATGQGERRTVTLADGTRIDLNAASEIRVKLTSRERHVVMTDAEAVFDVTRDPGRPFVIESGDLTVRVLGTQFGVRRRNGEVAVVVARGVVEVRPAVDEPGPRVRLTPGRRLDHVEGAIQSHVSDADPEEVFGWRSGRLIYRARPLSEVVADLNRYAKTPLRLADARTGEIRFSGVLILDDEQAIVRRLVALAPITSVPTEDSILLSSQ